jgi:ribonuclease I
MRYYIINIKNLFKNLFKIFFKNKKFYYLSLMKHDNNIYGYCVHGLWPQYDNNTYPKYLKKVDFDFTLLEPLMDDLIRYWKPTNTRYNRLEYFWKHEWKKHGSCTFTEISQYQYFQITLDLYKELMEKNINLEKYLKGQHYLIPLTLDFKLNL